MSKKKRNYKYEVCVLNHMNEYYYALFKKNRGYIKAHNENTNCQAALKMFKIKILQEIPNMEELEVGSSYLASEIYDTGIPNKKKLCIYCAKAPTPGEVKVRPVLHASESRLKEYIQFYPDAVIPMKVKRRVRTHKGA